MFADDTNFAVSGNPKQVPALMSRLRQCFETVFQWKESNHLQFNLDKWKLVVEYREYEWVLWIGRYELSRYELSRYE